MESNYTPVPKDSFVELQLHDDDHIYESNVIHKGNSLKLFNNEDEQGLVSHRIYNLETDDDFDTNKPNPYSGIYGAVFNLTTTVIGAGIMALPATMKVSGLVFGVMLIFFMGILSEISIELLVRFSVQCKALSYGEIVQEALGRPARILSEICIVVNIAGVLVVYLIIIGDVMSGSVDHIGVLDQWLGNGFWDHRKVVILIVVIVFLAPICVLDRIDSLSLTSAASVALAVVFVVVAFVVAFIKLVDNE